MARRSGYRAEPTPSIDREKIQIAANAKPSPMSRFESAVRRCSARPRTNGAAAMSVQASSRPATPAQVSVRWPVDRDTEARS